MRNNVLKLEKDVACDTETENRETGLSVCHNAWIDLWSHLMTSRPHEV